MGFFDFLRGDPVDQAARDAAQQRQQESQDALERGGLPLNAVERLQHQRETQKLPTHLWTSDLSVAELALVQDVGYEPLGQVMGASIYHVGFQWRSQTWRNSARLGGISYELDVLSAAFSQARQLAVGRLQQEAKLLGADGVVGVRLERRNSDWGGDSVEFQAIGTAIRERQTAHLAPAESPFVCALSGQDFWKLKQSGIRPVGLVAGNCTYYCVPSQTTQNVATGGIFNSASWRNQELPEFTQALFTAREIALERLTQQARQFQAHGTVGMTVEYDAKAHEVEVSNNQMRLDMLYHFLALGTAVRVEQRAPQIATKRVLSLQIMPVRPTSVVLPDALAE